MTHGVLKTDNVPSLLLPICLWPNGNLCTWAHDGRFLGTRHMMCPNVKVTMKPQANW